ncbi:MAG: hypothetical protein H0W20_13100 [Chthoniobacterales bacterium]|nr:hypothetical protein [Chthoniobacterales bacterium]
MNGLYELADRARREKLPFLVVGGHAVILYHVPRFTRDIDLLIPESAATAWLEFLQKFRYRVYHQTEAFIQLEPFEPGTLPPVDLMLVDAGTWAKLEAKAVEREAGGDLRLPVPHVWHLIAMKLAAAQSIQRRKEASDWPDVLHLVRVCQIDLANPDFRSMVMQYGGKEALRRLEKEAS